MSSTYKVFLAVLAVGTFGLGFCFRQATSWSSTSTTSDVVRQMAAYNSHGATSDVGTQSNVDLRPMETYYSVLRIVQDHFVERIQDSDKTRLAYSSIRTMLDSLKDPYTRFYEPKQTHIIEAAREGKFYGIGAMFAVKKDKVDDATTEKLCVVTTLPGSPAEKAGLKTGDVITEIDGRSVLPYDPYQKAARILKSARDVDADREKLQKELDAEDKRIKNGWGFQKTIDVLSSEVGKEYTLTIARPGDADPIKLKVGTSEMTVDPITRAVVDKNVGYIHVRLMTDPAADDFARAMSDFEKSGLKSLVIDLRDSPGGSTEVAGQMASWFAPNKVLANLMQAHDKKEVLKIPALKTPEGVTGRHWTGKVAVLIDGGTSGVAEVLTAALRDNKVGQTVGSTTFGQALQQTIYVLRDGSSVGVTTGKYLSPLGREFNLRGLPAEIRVASAANDGNDPQLARAIQTVKAQ